MGGSGSSGFSGVDPSELHRSMMDAELRAAEKKFAPKLAELLNSLITKSSERDEYKEGQRLDQIKDALKENVYETATLRYGGSVAKHTYVDGLSDVDMLLFVDDKASSPREVLARVAEQLTNKIKEADVRTGSIAVTLVYKDGMELQLIPSTKTEPSNKRRMTSVPAWDDDKWAAIDPDKFRRGLSKRNAEHGMKVIPTIKLFKSINGTLPKGIRLSGYHIESLAIAAFRDYDDTKSVEKMLPFFVRKSSQLVKSPMKDRTGQSVHVDEYMGKANSERRQLCSISLDRIARRMDNATASASLDQWRAILGV